MVDMLLAVAATSSTTTIRSDVGEIRFGGDCNSGASGGGGFRRRGARQAHGELAPEPRPGATRGDAAPLQLDQSAHEREADAEPAFGRVLRVAGLLEEVENALDVGRIKADARIANAKHEQAWFRLDGKPNATGRGRVFGGVREQIDQNLRETHAISAQVGLFGRERHAQIVPPFEDERAHVVEHVFGELAGFHAFPFQFDLARRNARHVEEVVDESNQVLELSAHHAVKLVDLRFVGTACVEQVQRVAQRGQRIAQLVRQHREEIIFSSVRFARMTIKPRVFHRGLPKRTAEDGRRDADDQANEEGYVSPAQRQRY